MAIRKRIPKAFCTTRDAAEILGISLRTAQLWCESGLLEAWKTAGGHRRIVRESIERLIRVSTTIASQTERWSPPAVPRRQQARLASTFRILVVEDDKDLRTLYAFRLSRWTMKPSVETAANVQEAVDRLGQCLPDMVVLDLNLPGQDGFHLLRRLREESIYLGIPVVVVSGLAPEEISRRGGVPAGVPVLPKPLPFEKLAAIAEGRAAQLVTRPVIQLA